MARLLPTSAGPPRPLLLLLLLLLLVLMCCTQSQAGSPEARCSKKCPVGQECQMQRKCWKGFCYTVAVCVTSTPPPPPPPPPAGPPSCQGVRCEGTKVCVLQDVICVTAPCYPVPVCIDDPCALAFCGTLGTRCVTQRRADSQPACRQFPECQFTSACVPRAQPKEGFCPAQSQVPATAGGNQCTYDMDCPSDLLCCPSAIGIKACAAPAFPGPCATVRCGSFAPTCAVRDGRPVCLDRVCRPGPPSFCRGDKQCYCSQGAVITCTDLPC